MKRVLVLAFYFPPLGGAGVQRTVKLLKHLEPLGYEAVVVTGPAGAELGWAPPDESLVAEVPASCRVERIATAPPGEARGLRPKLARWLAQPSARERWWRSEALAEARRAAGEVDLVYASMAPFGSASVAARIAGVLDVPWVADLRDPWALDDWTVYPTGLHRRLELRRMRRDLGNADAIVMNTDEARKALVDAFPELRARRVEVVPNGWDADDFAAPPPVRDDDRFRIVYTGYAHVAAGERHRRTRAVRRLLGGAVATDLLTRSHVLLVEALERLAARDPELAVRTELHVAGAGADPASEQTAGGARLVHHGYLPHDRAVALMRSADLLFLPMHDLPAGVRARTVPGKTYEYLASGRPILAALPDGDARDLLAPLPDVRLCRPADVDCIAAAVAAAAATPPTGATASPELLARLERRQLAIALARILDDVVGGPTA